MTTTSRPGPAPRAQGPAADPLLGLEPRRPAPPRAATPSSPTSTRSGTSASSSTRRLAAPAAAPHGVAPPCGPRPRPRPGAGPNGSTRGDGRCTRTRSPPGAADPGPARVRRGQRRAGGAAAGGAAPPCARPAAPRRRRRASRRTRRPRSARPASASERDGRHERDQLHRPPVRPGPAPAHGATLGGAPVTDPRADVTSARRGRVSAEAAALPHDPDDDQRQDRDQRDHARAA